MMETSEIYIKQCDCPEIQGQWKPQIGDIVYIKNTTQIWSQIEFSNACSPSRENYFIAVKKGGHYCILITNGLPKYLKKLVIWLPKQGQVQEMFNEKPFALSKIFDEEMENYITGDPCNWSFEMLWLAFYMWRKHKKIWSSKEEKWINDTINI